MAERKPDESFKVIDRRLFTSEGELRKEALDQEDRSPEATTPQKAVVTPTTEPPGKGTPAPPVAEPPGASRNFQLLVDFLGRNAAVLLGGFADPRTGQAILDLDGAQELIDMLDALHEKTRGNLTPDEDRFLVEVLGSLKLSYLEMTKAAAQATREKAPRKA